MTGPRVATLEDLLDHFGRLDAGTYEIDSCAGREPTEDDLRAFERRIGFRLPDDFRRFTRSAFGCLYAAVREHLWPRPQPHRGAPMWTFAYGLMVLGLSRGLPRQRDLRAQYDDFVSAPDSDGLVPFMRTVSSPDWFCFNRDGAIVAWNHEESWRREVLALSFPDLLLRELHELEERRGTKIRGEDTALPWMQDPAVDNPRRFAEVLAVLRGASHTLDMPAWATLRQLLERPEGCDVRLSANGMEIQQGWHPIPERPLLMYEMPNVVGELLRLGGARGPVDRIRAVIGPGTLTAPGGEVLSFDQRLLWIDAVGTTAVTIQTRSPGHPTVAKERPFDTTPAPFEFSPRFVDLPAPLPCPRCAHPATRYRRLLEGSLVCQTCGGSFRQ